MHMHAQHGRLYILYIHARPCICQNWVNMFLNKNSMKMTNAVAILRQGSYTQAFIPKISHHGTIGSHRQDIKDRKGYKSRHQINGPLQGLNPGPPTPEAKLILLDQADIIFSLFITLNTILNHAYCPHIHHQPLTSCMQSQRNQTFIVYLHPIISHTTSFSKLSLSVSHITYLQ